MKRLFTLLACLCVMASVQSRSMPVKANAKTDVYASSPSDSGVTSLLNGKYINALAGSDSSSGGLTDSLIGKTDNLGMNKDLINDYGDGGNGLTSGLSDGSTLNSLTGLSDGSTLNSLTGLSDGSTLNSLTDLTSAVGGVGSLTKPVGSLSNGLNGVNVNGITKSTSGVTDMAGSIPNYLNQVDLSSSLNSVSGLTNDATGGIASYNQQIQNLLKYITGLISLTPSTYTKIGSGKTNGTTEGMMMSPNEMQGQVQKMMKPGYEMMPNPSSAYSNTNDMAKGMMNVPSQMQKQDQGMMNSVYGMMPNSSSAYSNMDNGKTNGTTSGSMKQMQKQSQGMMKSATKISKPFSTNAKVESKTYAAY